MKRIQFDAKTMVVYVTDTEQKGGVNIPVAESDIVNDNPYRSRIPISSIIYQDVLYAAAEAIDRKEGKNVQYFLVPPDPWLVALGHVMWEGIVAGFTWDIIKLSVHAALKKLQHEGVAPPSDKHQTTRKEYVELGFCWTQYVGGKKQYEMFIGLRKAYERTQKRKLKKPLKTPSRKRAKNQ